MSTLVNKKPNTVFMPVTIMEEVPVLSPVERAELIASLQQAEADIAAGHFIEHNPDTFVQKMAAFRTAALNKKAL